MRKEDNAILPFLKSLYLPFDLLDLFDEPFLRRIVNQLDVRSFMTNVQTGMSQFEVLFFISYRFLRILDAFL